MPWIFCTRIWSDVNNDSNILLLPTVYGVWVLCLSDSRLIPQHPWEENQSIPHFTDDKISKRPLVKVNTNQMFPGTSAFAQLTTGSPCSSLICIAQASPSLLSVWLQLCCFSLFSSFSLLCVRSADNVWSEWMSYNQPDHRCCRWLVVRCMHGLNKAKNRTSNEGQRLIWRIWLHRKRCVFTE